MFYSNQTNNFLQLIITTNRVLTIKNVPFVFYEDIGEFVSIVKQPYENSASFVNDGNRTVDLAVVDKRPSFFIFSLIFLLQTAGGFNFEMLHFNEIKRALHFTFEHKNTILLRDMAMQGPQQLPYYTLGYHLYFKVNNNEYSPTFFLQTFHTSFWICFIGVAIVIFGCFWTVAKLLKQRYIFPLDFIYLILGNSIVTVNRTVSFHILFLTLLILLVIFYASFCALLDVLLAIKHIDVPFNSINDLLKIQDYTICMTDRSTIWHTVKNLKYQIDGKASINSEYCPKLHPIRLHWISDFTFECNWNKMAFFFTEKDTRFERFLIQKCKLAKFPGIFSRAPLSLVTSLEFSYKEIISQKIIMARTSGNIEYMTNKAYFNDLQLLRSVMIEKSLVEIEFEHCKLIILLLLIGMIVSFLILAVEILWMKISKKLAERRIPTKP